MADPPHRRIADDLRAKIETGQLEPGSQLPPEEKHGELFRASRNTNRDAVTFLISLGLAETRAGQGADRQQFSIYVGKVPAAQCGPPKRPA